MGRSKAIKRGKNFLAGGWGKYGPYLTYVRRVTRRGYGKISIGSKGLLIGGKYSGKKGRIQATYNASTGKPSFSAKRKRRR